MFMNCLASYVIAADMIVESLKISLFNGDAIYVWIKLQVGCFIEVVQIILNKFF